MVMKQNKAPRKLCSSKPFYNYEIIVHKTFLKCYNNVLVSSQQNS